jgi:hypothetical protein
MHLTIRASCVAVLFLVAVLPGRGADDKWIDLFAGDKPLAQFDGPSSDWVNADSVGLDEQNSKMLSFKAGNKGIWVNGPKGRTRDLVTKQKFGDVEVRLEFLIPKNSNSGIKLMGLYEIQIYDSHGKKELTGADGGGIYPRAELEPKYHHIDKGIAPKVNACKPAGEWQTLDIIFRAPRFDADGKKTANAKFVKVVMNGETIHENVDMEYPTGHAWHKKEVATGPVLLQADHGPVAFRNVRVRSMGEEKK